MFLLCRSIFSNLPILEWKAGEVRIIIARLPSNLLAQKIGLFERLIFAVKLNLGNNKPLIVAIKLINLKCMAAVTHQITAFINLVAAA